MFRLQFQIEPVPFVRALAWPSDRKHVLRLICNPFETILYGSEQVAIEDIDRWMEKFPCIREAEVVTLPIENEVI